MIDKAKIDRCQAVQISEKEALRLKGMGVDIPDMYDNGYIIYKSQKIGYANTFSGIVISDKDFAKTFLQDILWYVNERFEKCTHCGK